MHPSEKYVNVFTLARQFKDFVADQWTGIAVEFIDDSGASVNSVEPGDLFELFADWVRDSHSRVVSQTAGSHAMVVLTWVVISSWFSQRPEDFEAIRDHITTPFELSPDAPSLPFPLDEATWNAHVFTAIHGSV